MVIVATMKSERPQTLIFKTPDCPPLSDDSVHVIKIVFNTSCGADPYSIQQYERSCFHLQKLMKAKFPRHTICNVPWNTTEPQRDPFMEEYYAVIDDAVPKCDAYCIHEPSVLD